MPTLFGLPGTAPTQVIDRFPTGSVGGELKAMGRRGVPESSLAVRVSRLPSSRLNENAILRLKARKVALLEARGCQFAKCSPENPVEFALRRDLDCETGWLATAPRTTQS